jgi:methylenetetrahydrofolate--tRNA-(uracil-5-)-methyltransferase
MSEPLIIVGGGLAGCEAAWQAAENGISVQLYEMRPMLSTGAHRTDKLAELVCSNSLGSKLKDRASGIIMEELRLLNSLLLNCAEKTAVPAGDALAVDREAFSQMVTEIIEKHPKIRVIREEISEIPEGNVIMATGPLTSPRLSNSIKRLIGENHLYFYDAIAPLVYYDSINNGYCLSRFQASHFR